MSYSELRGIVDDWYSLLGSMKRMVSKEIRISKTEGRDVNLKQLLEGRIDKQALRSHGYFESSVVGGPDGGKVEVFRGTRKFAMLESLSEAVYRKFTESFPGKYENMTKTTFIVQMTRLYEKGTMVKDGLLTDSDISKFYLESLSRK